MTTATIEIATDRQLAFIDRLRTERGLEPLANWTSPPRLTKSEASATIDKLLATPRPTAQAHTAALRQATGTATVSEALTPGVYENADGIFIVKPNQAKTRLYAKRLVELTGAQGDRLSETDEHVRIEFEYAPGAIYTIKPEHRMPLDKGKALTLRYGKCICCGRKLKVAASVERGIGPVCVRYFA